MVMMFFQFLVVLSGCTLGRMKHVFIRHDHVQLLTFIFRKKNASLGKY